MSLTSLPGVAQNRAEPEGGRARLLSSPSASLTESAFSVSHKTSKGHSPASPHKRNVNRLRNRRITGSSIGSVVELLAVVVLDDVVVDGSVVLDDGSLDDVVGSASDVVSVVGFVSEVDEASVVVVVSTTVVVVGGSVVVVVVEDAAVVGLVDDVARDEAVVDEADVVDDDSAVASSSSAFSGLSTLAPLALEELSSLASEDGLASGAATTASEPISSVSASSPKGIRLERDTASDRPSRTTKPPNNATTPSIDRTQVCLARVQPNPPASTETGTFGTSPTGVLAGAPT